MRRRDGGTVMVNRNGHIRKVRRKNERKGEWCRFIMDVEDQVIREPRAQKRRIGGKEKSKKGGGEDFGWEKGMKGKRPL